MTLENSETSNKNITDCNNNLDHNSLNISGETENFESDITRAIKESIDRSSRNYSTKNDLSFKEVIDLARDAINEIPIMANKTGKKINKMVTIGKDGINNINNFTNALKESYKDKVSE